MVHIGSWYIYHIVRYVPKIKKTCKKNQASFALPLPAPVVLYLVIAPNDTRWTTG